MQCMEKILGVIAEFNPLHLGHEYFLKEAKRQTGASHIVALMSGDFVQRGEPAITDMHIRAEMALNHGADLVLELPAQWAAASAEAFALGSVGLLSALGAVDMLAFGSEEGNLSELNYIAGILSEEPDEYKQVLKNLLSTGKSYPAARAAALSHYALSRGRKDEEAQFIKELISKSNNILAIEYLKALKKLSSPIKPFTLKREGSPYDSKDLNDSFPSALSIRAVFSAPMKKAAIQGNLDNTAPAHSPFCENASSTLASIGKALPSTVLKSLSSACDNYFPIVPDDFSALLRYRLTVADGDSLNKVQGMTPHLAKRILKKRWNYTCFTAFSEDLKSKDSTLSAVKRSLLHLILGFQGDAIPETPPYARILGFKASTAPPLLKRIKKAASIPIISRAAVAKDILDPVSLALYEDSLRSALIYEGVSAGKFNRVFRHEYQRPIVIVP